MPKRLVLVICSFSISFVQAKELEHCNTLIDHGITNITRQMSAEHSIAYKWHSNCGQDFSSASDSSVRKAGISVFGYGSADSGSNTAQTRKRLKTWCDKNSAYAESRSDLFEEARTISKPALDAWNQCQKIANKGIGIDVSIQGENDEYVNFTIDSTSDGEHLFYGVTESGYSCKINGKDGKEVQATKIDKGKGESLLMSTQQTKIDNKNIHISCNRNPPAITEAKGVGKVIYPQGHISVMTSGPALPITLPKVVETYYVTPPDSVLAFTSSRCPEGWRPLEEAKGRVILGAGNGNGLSHRNLMATGGAETHTLTAEELPQHSHQYTDHYVAHNPTDRYEGLAGAEWRGNGNPGFGRLHPNTSAVGSNQAHNNMPPFLALNYCVRK